MKAFLDRFILGFPVLFLKQYPYAWIATVVLLPTSPTFAALFLGIVVIGILSLRWQSAAWISEMRRQYADRGGKFYVDQPPVPWQKAARNIALLIAASALIAFLLKGRLGLTFWQFFLLILGLTLFYRDTLFFGSAATYIITASGIAIRFVPGHIDYRLFLPFREISRIERADYQKRMDTDLFARTRDVSNGLLMIPKDPKGFTKRIDKLFIAPQNIDQFVEQLPYGFGKVV
jgi:hypothetical protein